MAAFVFIGNGLLCVIPAKAGIQNKKNMIDKNPCVYIIASKRNGTLYTGVTSHLIQRITQHKQEVIDGFTKKYGVHTLVWYELHQTMESAILREKRIKEWKRAWKIRLIMEVNPSWHDLYNLILV